VLVVRARGSSSFSRRHGRASARAAASLARLPFRRVQRVASAAENSRGGAAAARRALRDVSRALTTLSCSWLAVSMWLALLCFDLHVSPLAALIVTITAKRHGAVLWVVGVSGECCVFVLVILFLFFLFGSIFLFFAFHMPSSPGEVCVFDAGDV